MEHEVRLVRIEAKLDQLAEAITALARVEERLVSHRDVMTRAELRLDRLEDSISKTIHRLDTATTHITMLNRLLGAIGVGCISVAGFLMSQHFWIG